MKAGNLRVQESIHVFLIVVLLCPFAYGKTIYVDNNGQADFDNIQAGIDAANDSDTVLVAPGEYVITEPITFRGKAITVMSEAGPDVTTIRMGTPFNTNRGSVIVFENNETSESVLDGFTITGGKGIFIQGVWGGGGILFIASSGTLNNCVIVQNRSRDAGGGVCCAYDSSVTMNNCTIMENSAEGGGGGGGVIVYSGSSATLTNCDINRNSANIESGGGICCAYDSLVTINNCTIVENSTQRKGGGGVMSYNKSQATLNNCLIARNSTQWGGGVMSERESSSTLTNCIICENSASLEGGGVVCYNKSLTTITNCTIWGNSAAQSGGGLECLDWSSSTVTNSIIWKNLAPKGRELSVQDAASTLTITYSNVADGQTGIRVDGGSTLDWGVGNIDADPCFADPNNENYHLMSQAGRWDPNSQTWIQDDVTSPCIDGGDPNSSVGDEPEPNGGRINMGAYGGTSEASKSADVWWFETTQGVVTAEGLGVILPHEHIFTDLRGPGARGYGQADAADVVRVMAPLLEEAKEAGVGLLFECSSIGVGRNASILSEVSKASGLPVVVPTGVYGRANFAPPEHKNMSEDELTELFVSEIRDGIEDTGIKAGFIKIATGGSDMNALEEKILRAAGRAALETGAAVASHTSTSNNVTKQADILESIGPEIRFIWVHAQSVNNRSLYRQLAEHGVFIEFDSLGWNPGQDSTFISAIKDLLAAGFGEQILLSHDAGWYRPGVKDGGTQKPYTYLIETFIPKLRDSGIDDETIQMITEINPIRAFGFSYEVSP